MGITPLATPPWLTLRTYNHSWRTKLMLQGQNRNHRTILQLLYFLRITKTKNYMFCSPDNAGESR